MSRHRLAVVILGLMLLLFVVVEVRYFMLRQDCMEAGYLDYDSGFCVRKVEGSDEVVPYRRILGPEGWPTDMGRRG